MAIITPGIPRVKNHKTGNPDKYFTSLPFKFLATKKIFKLSKQIKATSSKVRNVKAPFKKL